MERLETSTRPERGYLGTSVKRGQGMMGMRKWPAPPLVLILFKIVLFCNKRATGDEAD